MSNEIKCIYCKKNYQNKVIEYLFHLKSTHGVPDEMINLALAEINEELKKLNKKFDKDGKHKK